MAILRWAVQHFLSGLVGSEKEQRMGRQANYCMLESNGGSCENKNRRKPPCVAGSVGTSHKTIGKTLHQDHNSSKVSPHTVLRMLTTDQKETRIHLCQEWLEADEDDIFSRVITGDESCLFEYDIQKNGLK